MPEIKEQAAVKSKGIWGSVLAFVPLALQVVQSVAEGLPPTPTTTAIVAAVGGILMIISKLQPQQSQVTGIVAPKNASKSENGL